VREAVARRKVSVREVEPGLARITADVPVAEGVGAVGRLREAATVLFGQNQAEKTAHAATTTPTGDTLAETTGTEPGSGVPADPEPTNANPAEVNANSNANASANANANANAEVDSDSDGAAPVCDERSVVQIMADMFCDLLLTAPFAGHGATDDARDALSAIRPQVQVTIPAETLTGARVGGAVVDGVGPVGDDTARRLAGGCSMWSRVFTDPATGVPVCVDRYRPSKRQKRFLQARDQQCRFPGCRRRAQKCDIDHTVPHAAGGPTCLCNLEHFCKRHHTVKHDTAWDVEQRAGGVLIFTAPTKRTYATRPPGTVRFEPVALIDPDPHDQHMIAAQDAHDPAPF